MFGKNKTNVKTNVEQTNQTQEKQVQSTEFLNQIPFNEIVDNSGIFKVGAKRYSKLYSFADMNFLTLTEDEQLQILEKYLDFINKFQDTVSIQLLIANRMRTEEETKKAFYKNSEDESTKELVDAYNKIIDSKIEEGNNYIKKGRYICISTTAENPKEASQKFANIDMELNEVIQDVNKSGVTPLSTYERLELLDHFYNGSDEYCDFEKMAGKYADVQNEFPDKFLNNVPEVKRMIAPQIFDSSDKSTLVLSEDRVCKTFSFNELPPSLDTKFLNRITDTPCEMLVSVFLDTVEHQKAVNKVKVQNNIIKSDIGVAQQKAFEGGYSSDLINEDLQIAREEAKELRHDIVIEGKKLFEAYITVTLFANTKEELQSDIDVFKMKTGDFSIRPHHLMREQIQGLQQSLPFADNFIDLKYSLSSDSCCALFPFNIKEIQDENGVFYGINTISKNMIIFDRKNAILSNGLVFGKSRSGKSFIVKGEIISNVLSNPDDRVIILDPEREYSKMAEALGGEVIYLQTKTDKHINPCDLDMEWGEKDADPLTEKCDFMVGLVESILGGGRECNSFEVNVIHRATNRMYQEYIEIMEERYQRGIKESIDYDIAPTLENFYEELLQDNSPEGTKIAMAIEPYCIGNYNIFAHRTNIDVDNKVIVYDLADLPSKMMDMAMNVCLSNIWTKICANRRENKAGLVEKFLWVYLDEFHLFCQSRQTLSTIKAYYKRCQKYNGIMTGITQDISDVGATLDGMGIIENSGFILLMNQNANGRALTKQRYGCSDKMLSYITDKPRGMGLLYNGETIIPFNYRLPSDNKMYEIMTSKASEQ